MKSSEMNKKEKTVITVGDCSFGAKKIIVIAGPCSVESEGQIKTIAEQVKTLGARILRGGAFKPRTSPYSFQGLEYEGLELLKLARTYTGLPIITEITSPYMIEKYVQDVDIIQVGARNMQNFELLKELGKIKKPILLKRGLSATIDEFLLAAEYILFGGNENVILCERGIRTFETATKNTLDLSAIPILKSRTHLPIVVDPSHAAGIAYIVPELAYAAVAVGADGIMVEVHNNPSKALCDGEQSITPEQFAGMMKQIKKIAQAIGRDV